MREGIDGFLDAHRPMQHATPGQKYVSDALTYEKCLQYVDFITFTNGSRLSGTMLIAAVLSTLNLNSFNLYL